MTYHTCALLFYYQQIISFMESYLMPLILKKKWNRLVLNITTTQFREINLISLIIEIITLINRKSKTSKIYDYSRNEKKIY